MRMTKTNTNRTMDMAAMCTDVAHMMFMRDVHRQMIEDQYVLFPLADASSMRFGNVMMAEYFFIKGKDDLLRAGASAISLKASLPRDAPFPDDAFAFSELHNSIIVSVSGHHIWPTTALGQKKSNLSPQAAQFHSQGASGKPFLEGCCGLHQII